MSQRPHRTVYTVIADVSARDACGPLDSVVDAWHAWVATRVARKKEVLERTTGQTYQPDPVSRTDGFQTPVDGLSLDVATWASQDDSGSKSAVLTTREFQGADRFWRTDLRVGQLNERCTVVVRMGPETAPNVVRPHGYDLSAPGIWRELCSRVSVSPHGTNAERGAVLDYDAALQTLLGTDRRLPLVVVSVCNRTGESAFCPDLASIVSEQLFGVAHVAHLPTESDARRFSDEIGSEHSCYNGAVRVYWPGFQPQDRPNFRWLLLPERFARPYDSHPERAFARMLLRRLALIASSQYHEPDLLAELTRVRRAEETALVRDRIRHAMKSQESDAAMAMIEELQQQHSNELERLKEHHQQELRVAYAQWDGEEEEEEDSADDAPSRLTVDYFCAGNKRRPVLDFADDTLGKSPEIRRRYLDALTSLPDRWETAQHDFDKVTGASVASKTGIRWDLYEYRAIKQQGQWVRVFFAIVDQSTALLLHACQATTTSAHQ